MALEFVSITHFEPAINLFQSCLIYPRSPYGRPSSLFLVSFQLLSVVPYHPSRSLPPSFWEFIFQAFLPAPDTTYHILLRRRYLDASVSTVIPTTRVFAFPACFLLVSCHYDTFIVLPRYVSFSSSSLQPTRLPLTLQNATQSSRMTAQAR